MICLLLIMTMIFINSAGSVEQRVRHTDTLLKEEDMNARTKAWLLMVESGKVDQEELRRITPKSIFIAPLLTSRTGKCKEGYRHDHLGQCVKVIKIDPKVQLELLLQKLNKLYGEKKEEEEREEEEVLEVSNGPLHFSLPISTVNEKVNQTNTNSLDSVNGTNSTNVTTPISETVMEFMPVPLPMVYQNKTNETKEIESSGAEPLNETDIYEAPYEGSGDGLVSSGDGFQDDSTTVPPVSLLFEETDYSDTTETESNTVTETPSTTELPEEEPTTVKEIFPQESYQINSNMSSVNESTEVSQNVQKTITVQNNPNSDKIYFPSDDSTGSKFPVSSPVSSRIRFPDEEPPRYSDLSSKPSKYQIDPSEIPQEQFWWLPKNWEIDENQQKSPLVKIWSRLPLMHDITYASETPRGFRKSLPVEQAPVNNAYYPHQRSVKFPARPEPFQPSNRGLKPFRTSRFQDILLTPRQNFRFQR